jgi:hypothetical protein
MKMEGFLAIERGWFLFILVGSGNDIRDLSPIYCLAALNGDLVTVNPNAAINRCAIRSKSRISRRAAE